VNILIWGVLTHWGGGRGEWWRAFGLATLAEMGLRTLKRCNFCTSLLYTPSPLRLGMAKGANDVILRDRLQFDIDAIGDTPLVYGRIDLSDYVSIVENKGLAIKEIRFQLRRTSASGVGIWPNIMNDLTPSGLSGTIYDARLKIFATTTAYELPEDVGIASPNVLCVFEKQSTAVADVAPGAFLAINTYEHMFGTPDLHPEGYDVVTDLLIGISLDACKNLQLVDTTAELDVMLIAEPKKITQKDLTQMLTQAQDL